MLKIFSVGLLFGIILLFLRSVNYEIYTLGLITAGLLLLTFAVSYVSKSVDVFREISERANVSTSVFKILLKTVGIGTVTEFTASVVGDFGIESLSKKIVFLGKIFIVYVSLPILTTLFELLTEFA